MKSKWFILLGVCLIVLLFSFLLGQNSVKANSRYTDQVHRAYQSDLKSSLDDLIWTNWHPNQYAIADDGQAIWIGATGSIIRWDKVTSTYQRYGSPDGLPHQVVLAVAIDQNENRWFGGDGGLSRLDTDNKWTHFTVNNSPLPTDYIDAIAITDDNTLWLSHGLPDGGVSRLTDHGTWEWYSNRTEAVSSAYLNILQTQNINGLWVVADNEVWVDYQVFDGNIWIDRTPLNYGPIPMAMAVNSQATVWVLANDSTILSWQNELWVSYPIGFYFDGVATTLTADSDDVIWVGWKERNNSPYTNRTAGLSQVPSTPGIVDLEYFLDLHGSFVSLLPSLDGLWGLGPGWLLHPDQTSTVFEDIPHFSEITHVIADTTGSIWLHSQYADPYTGGIMQSLNDHHTPALNDDQWELSDHFGVVTSLELAPNNDLWATREEHGRFNFSLNAWRYHQDTWFEYHPPFNFFATDTFAQAYDQTWFAYSTSSNQKGALLLNEQNTIADPSDDTWTAYPIETTGYQANIAVDSLGRLWYGDSQGLYRYNGTNWDTIDASINVCDLVPANNGILFIQQAGIGCSQPSQNIIVRHSDSFQEMLGIQQLIAQHLDLVRSASRYNRIWAVAPDNAVWYIASNPSLQLYRRDDFKLSSFALPTDEPILSLAVGSNTHVWLATHSMLWRLSPRLDFTSFMPLVYK